MAGEYLGALDGSGVNSEHIIGNRIRKGIGSWTKCIAANSVVSPRQLQGEGKGVRMQQNERRRGNGGETAGWGSSLSKHASDQSATTVVQAVMAFKFTAIALCMISIVK